MIEHIVYLALGSNLGDKELQLSIAVEEIKKQVGELLSLSDFYVTLPCGFISVHTFLNATCCVQTSCQPDVLLKKLKAIEKKMGRKKKSINEHYEDRIIDLDILFYDDLIISTPSLKIPHPLLHKRKFVLSPLIEIAPDLVHPILGQTMHELYQILEM